MDTAELLDALTHYDALPEAAIREATERRAEMAPLFVKAIEAFIADPTPPAEIADRLFLIVHLLGSWHEKSAYRCVARLLQCAPSRVDQVLGGAITETLPGIMLNLFDGDPRPLYDVVECEAADEFVRSAMLEVLATLAERGDLAKGAFAAYLGRAFATLRPQGESYVWVGWQSAIALLGLGELSDSVQQVFACDWISPMDTDFDDFAADLLEASRDPTHPRLDELRARPFGDTIETLSKWYCFSEEYLAKRRAGIDVDEDGLDEYGLDDFEPDEEYLPQEPVTNPFRHVGRNDPCPCGSGKKFKRCCLGKAA